MNSDDKISTILDGVQEVTTEEELGTLLEEKENPRSYIGFAPTGTLHLGHLLTMGKIPDFQDAGIQNTILVADEHARIDAEKSDEELVDARAEYYEEGLRSIVDAVGGDEESIDFVLGSDFQFDRDYIRAVRKMKHNTTANRMEHALGDVVAQNEDGEWNASVYDYPPMQAQDVVGVDADIAFSGADQRSLYMYAREMLDEEDKPVWISAPMLAGLTGGKMSSSDKNSKISIHDTYEQIQDKVNSAHMENGQVEENGVLDYAQHLIFPYLNDQEKDFVIERPDQYGGNIAFSEYEDLEEEYASENLHPQDLKNGVAQELGNILEPVRTRFESKQDILHEAYSEGF